jgi:hypothetical protein
MLCYKSLPGGLVNDFPGAGVAFLCELWFFSKDDEDGQGE